MIQEEAKKYCQDNVLNYGWDGVQQEHIIDAFVAGAEWQANQSQWISVKEDLPGNRNNVLVRNEKGMVFLAFFDNNTNKWFALIPIFNRVLNITHWMAIPKFNGHFENN